MKTDYFKELINEYKNRSIKPEKGFIKNNKVILASESEVFGIIDMVKHNNPVGMFMQVLSYLYGSYGDNSILSLEESLAGLVDGFMRLDCFRDRDELYEYISDASKSIESLYEDGFYFVVNPKWEE